MPNPSKLIPVLLTIFSLGAIIYLAVFIRSGTLSAPTVLDYDPWWQYRHAKEIYDNGFSIPDWDILSYYPPGRPYAISQGWPFTIAFFYEVLKNFINIDFMQAGKLAPLIMVALIPIPAFLLGRLLSNNIGGLVAALFAIAAPTFIGVSMAGYTDTDAPVAFYMFASVFTIFLAIKNSNKKLMSIPLYVLAVFTTLIFVFNWGAGWFPLILFLAFIPALIVFRLVEEMWYQKKVKLYFRSLLPEVKSILLPLIIIFLATNIIAVFLGFNTMFQSLKGALGFTGLAGEPLIVNISVAELQIINIFTKSGFNTVAERVGVLPTIMTLIGLPLLALYKVYKKERISFVEIFLFLWALVTFYLIIKGIRFSLLFSMSSSIASGYVIGNLFNYLKNRNVLLLSSVFAVISVFVFISVSTAVQIGLSSGGLTISQNWYDGLDWLKENADKDSLVSTWWDPGHIIAGYTGLKVHADGAHCVPGNCIPYDHNIRIKDMGKIFSTADENESIEILRKYTSLTDDQCNQAKEKFGDKFPEEACKDVTEVYVLATNDLIGKYFWMSCFGSFDMNLWKSTAGDKWKCDGKNFLVMPFTQFDRSGFPIYSGGGLTLTLLQNETQLLAVMTAPSQGIRSVLVSDVVYYQGGQELQSKSTGNNVLDGMVWIDPGFGTAIYMEPDIRDSIFTKMFFFNGKDLEKFEMVYQNPEMKIFKARFG
ncbi:MAG: hypothetical protein HYS62_00995 [Candidatus Aenigmarchaeota archaeon]|nr:hypothetical protein [Candidatus Aenigmarchaeota archaeon]